jgi:hypothetical protein
MSLLAPDVVLVAPQRLAHHLAAADVAPGFDLLAGNGSQLARQAEVPSRISHGIHLQGKGIEGSSVSDKVVSPSDIPLEP